MSNSLLDNASFVKLINMIQVLAYPSLLLPLSLPEDVWMDTPVDFIESLPKSYGKNVIWVVIDRLCKDAHFVSF